VTSHPQQTHLVFAKNMLFTDIEIVKNFKSDTLILNTY